MQLRFLSSFRWCSDPSTEHFEILDTVDNEGENMLLINMLLINRLVRGGVIFTRYQGRLEKLIPQLVDSMRLELDMMTQTVKA